MKILVNAFSARLGGGQTYIINLIRFLPVIEGVEIIVMAPDALKLDEDHPNVRRFRTKWPVTNPFLRTFWERLFLPQYVRRMGIDVLFCPGGVVSTNVGKNCKVVTMFRNMMPFDLEQRKKYPWGYMRIRNWLLQRVMLKSMLKADLVIFISEYARKFIENFSHRQFDHAVVIPHGINPIFRYSDENRAMHQRPQWLPSEEFILYVSILDVYKAQLEVVRGFALLKASGHREKLVLIGPDFTDYAQLVKQEIENLGLEDEVVVLGEVPYQELPAAYRNAKVNVFASECENCPNILLEALASARPVLVSNRPPMPEFGGKAVEYFDPSSPEDFCSKLGVMLSDPDRLNELAISAGRQAMIYDWQRTAERTWQEIFRLAER